MSFIINYRIFLNFDRGSSFFLHERLETCTGTVKVRWESFKDRNCINSPTQLRVTQLSETENALGGWRVVGGFPKFGVSIPDIETSILNCLKPFEMVPSYS